MEMEEKKKQAYRVGAIVFMLLVIMMIGEYFIGSIAPVWWAPLLGVAILKAFFILRDYMHIGRVFAADEESHK